MKFDKGIIKIGNMLSREARKLDRLFDHRLVDRGVLGWGKKNLSIISADFQRANFAAEQIEIILREQKEFLEQITADRLEEIKMLAPTALQFTPLIQGALSINNNIIANLENAYIELPPTHFEIETNEYTNFTNIINEFNSYKSLKNDYLLRTTTTETTDLGFIKFRTVQQTQLQVQSLQSEVNELKNYIKQDGKKKDEMLEELLDYYRNGGTNTVKVKKVKYNKRTAELIIDDKIISIKAYTKQHYLCKVLFSSKASIKRVWEIYDIVEAWNEDTSILKKWIKVIYSTVRHLNTKIQLQTGIDRFIIFDNKAVIINPNYLDLT